MTLEKFLETRSIITKNRELPKASKWKSSAPVSPPSLSTVEELEPRMEMSSPAEDTEPGSRDVF